MDLAWFLVGLLHRSLVGRGGHRGPSSPTSGYVLRSLEAHNAAPERDACEAWSSWKAEMMRLRLERLKKLRGVAQKGASTSRGLSRDQERVIVTP